MKSNSYIITYCKKLKKLKIYLENLSKIIVLNFRLMWEKEKFDELIDVLVVIPFTKEIVYHRSCTKIGTILDLTSQ